MKRKGVLIAGAVGFIAASLLAYQVPHQDVIKTTGEGFSGYNVMQSQGSHIQKVHVGLANLERPTIASLNEELRAINKELKDSNITLERKKELKERKKKTNQHIENLKKKKKSKNSYHLSSSKVAKCCS